MDIRSRLSYLEVLHKSSVSRVRSLETEVGLLEVSLDLANEANLILDRLAEDEVTQGVSAYVCLLEEGLKAIFPEQEVGLHAEVLKLRGKVSVRLKTSFKGEDGIEVVGEGLDSFGGAVATIQSLLLRVSLVLKRNLRPLLVLDETFPSVDVGRSEILVGFLKVLCQRLNMDILCISHDSTIADGADIGYKVTASKTGAKIKRIT
mgnify:CR=1 FL=1|jgi:hypothetical protein